MLLGWAQTSPITAGLRDPRVEYADSQLPNVMSAAWRTGAAGLNIDSGSARLTMMSPTAATRTLEPIVVSLARDNCHHRDRTCVTAQCALPPSAYPGNDHGDVRAQVIVASVRPRCCVSAALDRLVDERVVEHRLRRQGLGCGEDPVLLIEGKAVGNGLLRHPSGVGCDRRSN
jgi:hypothetical protein